MTPFGPKTKNIDTHDLVKTGDPEIKLDCDLTGSFPPYCDRNGEVVLAYCWRCGGGESELDDASCIERLLKKAIEREKALPPLQRAINHLEQRRSWVTGEMRMNDDASPNGVTKEEASRRLSEVAPEYVVLDELLRLTAAEAARNVAERVAADGTTRKQHYGSGRQPWDDIRDAGWGPEFCASNVLKYLRRDKDRAHSLESARVYYDWLNRLVLEQRATGVGRAVGVLNHLDHLLTPEERATVQEGLTI